MLETTKCEMMRRHKMTIAKLSERRRSFVEMMDSAQPVRLTMPRLAHDPQTGTALHLSPDVDGSGGSNKSTTSRRASKQAQKGVGCQ